MNRFFPRSLPAWLLVVLIGALAVSQVSTLVLTSHLAAQSSRTSDLFRLMQRVTGVMQILESAKPQARSQTMHGLSAESFLVSNDATPAVAEVIASDDELAEFSDLLEARVAPYGAVDLRIAEYLPASVTGELPFHISRDAGPVESNLSELSADFQNTNQFAVSIQLADKSWLNIRSPLSPAPSFLDLDNIAWYVLFSAAILLTCIWAILQLTAPYRKLETAMTMIGNNLNAAPLVEEGSSEVRSVIRAVNAMQQRLIEYVADREYLAAALAHDLRTPLTRMRIRCELPVSEAAWPKFAADVREVEQIVNSVLDYAGFAAGEKHDEDIEVTSLVRSACDSFDNAEYLGTGAAHAPIIVTGNAAALRRCMANLIENAIVYGSEAKVSVRRDGDFAAIAVSDKGAGIPENELKMVVRPFYRTEKSRSRETGGVGLGLSIVDKIMRAHGGKLMLENQPGGGLRVVLSIPLKRGAPAAA